MLEDKIQKVKNKGFLIILLCIALAVPFVIFYSTLATPDKKFTENSLIVILYLLFFILGLMTAFGAVLLFAKMDSQRKKNILLFFSLTTIVYALYLFLYSFSRFNTYLSEAVDFPYYHFAIWQLSEFKNPVFWDFSGRYVWSDHFEPILLFFVPLYWIIKSNALLMLLQAGWVLSGALPLYLMVKNKFRSALLAISISLSYLAFGGLQFGYAYGFHPIMLFPPFFFWMYYFYLHKKPWLYVSFIFLALLVKEEVAFIMIFWGIYVLLIKREKFYGLSPFLLGIFWYVFCFYVIFPFFSHGGGFGHWGQYNQTGGTGGLLGIVLDALFHPLAFISSLFTPADKIGTFFHIFGSFAFLPFFYPPSLLIILPSLLEKLLSSNIASMNGAHYSAAITAVMVIANIETLFVLCRSRWVGKIIHHKEYYFAALITYVAISSSIVYGYYPLSPLYLPRELAKTLPDNELDYLNQVIAALPSDAVVAAQSQILPHINKPMAQLRPIQNAMGTDFVIIDLHMPIYFPSISEFKTTMDKLVSSGKYTIAIDQNGLMVLRRNEYKLKR